MRHTLSSAVQPPCPSRGAFDWGKVCLISTLICFYFCSLMWYLPAITLICGQSQVKCINHMHVHTQMCRLHLKLRKHIQILTLSKRNNVFTNLRGSAMNLLAHRVFDTISETAKIVFLYRWSKNQHDVTPVLHIPTGPERHFFFPSVMGCLCFKFTLWLIFKFLSFLHSDSKLERKD